jgi:hypothetical protein
MPSPRMKRMYTRTCLTHAPCTTHTHTPACGLYYAAELAEEYASATKRIIAYSVLAVVALHGLLLVESFPILVLAGGIACHAVYGWLLMDFPNVEVFSLKFLFALGALCADHYIWFQYLQSRPPTIKSAFQTMVRTRKEVEWEWREGTWGRVVLCLVWGPRHLRWRRA